MGGGARRQQQTAHRCVGDASPSIWSRGKGTQTASNRGSQQRVSKERSSQSDSTDKRKRKTDRTTQDSCRQKHSERKNTHAESYHICLSTRSPLSPRTHATLLPLLHQAAHILQDRCKAVNTRITLPHATQYRPATRAALLFLCPFHAWCAVLCTNILVQRQCVSFFSFPLPTRFLSHQRAPYSLLFRVASVRHHPLSFFQPRLFRSFAPSAASLISLVCNRSSPVVKLHCISSIKPFLFFRLHPQFSFNILAIPLFSTHPSPYSPFPAERIRLT